MYVDHSPTFLTREDLKTILGQAHWYLSGLVFAIGNGSYDLDVVNQPAIEYQSQMLDAYAAGQTLVIRGLENYNEAIANYARSLGHGVDVHCFLVPEKGGTAFGMHTDERDVVIHRVYGDKDYEIIRDGVTLTYHMSYDQGLLIKCGEQHRAVLKGPSAILSFGIPENYELPSADLD
jgi:hypothetical protein